jgi:membrane-bound lytic murein transglycosylase MltF
VDYASSVAARYLKDINGIFSRATVLTKTRKSLPVKNVSERKKFVLAAYNGGEGCIAEAQRFAVESGKRPDVWAVVKEFLLVDGATKEKAREICNYVEKVLDYELEFARKSLADKKEKNKTGKSPAPCCSAGHWRTIDGRPVFICD